MQAAASDSLLVSRLDGRIIVCSLRCVIQIAAPKLGATVSSKFLPGTVLTMDVDLGLIRGWMSGWLEPNPIAYFEGEEVIAWGGKRAQ